MHVETDAACGRVRIFLDEQIVNVKCLADCGYVVFMVFTLTTVHCAHVRLDNTIPLLDALFPAGVSQRRLWRELPAWRRVYEAKEGQSVLCSDARFADPDNSDDVEVFLGTNAGMTVVLIVPEDGRATAKSELRQTSGGFSSLFRSPAKTLTGGQRVSCVLVEGQDKVLTLSEDGKVKRWNSRTCKCLAERTVTVEDDVGTGRVSTLAAFNMCLVPRHRRLIFALRSEDAPGANRLVECDVEKIADLRPQGQMLDCILDVVAQKLQALGESNHDVELRAMGPAVIGEEDDDDGTVLVTGWQGVSASVTVMTRFDDDWTTEPVVSQCAELREQVELASLYLSKCSSNGHASADGAPEPLELIQETIFRPGRCVVWCSSRGCYLWNAFPRAPCSHLRCWVGCVSAGSRLRCCSAACSSSSGSTVDRHRRCGKQSRRTTPSSSLLGEPSRRKSWTWSAWHA